MIVSGMGHVIGKTLIDYDVQVTEKGEQLILKFSRNNDGKIDAKLNVYTAEIIEHAFDIRVEGK